MTDSRNKPADTDGVPSPGEVIASKYEVERVLGVGGMGVVVAARHLQLGQRVAVKFMRGSSVDDAAAVARFLREARAVVAMRSEHVARVLDVGTLETGAPYIVMEFLAGVDLAQMLERRGRLAVPEAIGLLLQACEAIAEAHALGIVHRDLKPSNIFITQGADGSPLVKVLDFGISKVTTLNARAEGHGSLTGSGHVMGSPGYMSPEQLRSLKATDARSDVWSLGVILYELLAGAAAFPGETLGDILARIVAEEPIPIRSVRPDVPAGLASVIARCLEKSVTARTPSVAVLARALLPFAPPGSQALVERISRISGTPDGREAERTLAIAHPDAPPQLASPGGAGPAGSDGAKVETAAAWLQAASREPRSASSVVKLGVIAMVATLIVAVTVVIAVRGRAATRTESARAPTPDQTSVLPSAPSALPASDSSQKAAADSASSAITGTDAGAPRVGSERTAPAAGIRAVPGAAPSVRPAARRPAAQRPAAPPPSDEAATEEMFQHRR